MPITTVPHDPDDPAEVAAIQTPDGQPDAELIDPASIEDDGDDESSEQVAPG
jgi:hypothetical protein